MKKTKILGYEDALTIDGWITWHKDYMRKKDDTLPKGGRLVKVPVVLVEADKPLKIKQVKFWCEWCKEYHHHMDSQWEKDGLTHRSSHCYTEGSPLNTKKGYYLRRGEKNEKSERRYCEGWISS
jgi:hypothetical protein